MKFLILPFIPIAIGFGSLVAWLVGAAAAVTVLIKITKSIWGEDNSLKICALGPNQSGKTLFFNALRGDSSVHYQESGLIKIEEFTKKFPNGKTIKFAKTVDFNGSKDWIKSNYNKVMNGCNRVFFFCNLHDYLNNTSYERDVNARLDLIWDILDPIPDLEKYTVQKLYIILSYADKCKDIKESTFLFETKLSNRPKYGLFSTRVAGTINMTNQKDVDELINKMFCDE